MKRRGMGLVAGLGLALASLATPGIAANGLRLQSDLDSLRADEQFNWSLPLVIHNSGTRGLYIDSLWIQVQTGTEAPPRLDFQPLVRGMAALSVGDSNQVRLSLPASTDVGRAVLTVVGHDGDGTRLREMLVRPIAAGELGRFPSRRAGAKGSAVEWIRFPASASAVPASGAPGLMLLPDDTGSARDLMRLAQSLSELGFAVACMSPPGTGRSEGSPDRGGTATQRAIASVLDSLVATPGIDRTRLGVWGVSHTATAALGAAASQPRITAVVAQSAWYDAASGHRGLLATPARVLVLHGAADTVSSAADARDFAARRQAAGAPVTEQILPGQPHVLARGAAVRAATAFLREALGLTRP